MRHQTLILGRNARPLIIGFVLIFAILMSSCSTRRKSVRRPVKSSEPNLEVSIIPEPVSTTATGGHFDFSRDTKIIATDEYASRAAKSLNGMLLEKYGFTLEISDDTSADNSIEFSTDQSSSAEAYALRIDPDSIQISGTERGMFYGVQSLIQLFPSDFNGEAPIPAAEIVDAPRFRYRGMHLDVSRHFMSIEFVEKFINLISRYKFNYFHWHLTDDQGWRIEIKKWPRLTEIGSKRRESADASSFKHHVYLGDKIPVEGFYTQEQIREVAAYAKARYVTIIPEIDIPGHSSSALASYPSLGCRDNYLYKVQTTWGAFPDIFCPKEATFQFIEDVLTEVIDLFPDSPYIHIGGDEVMTDSWRTSKFVQDLKRTNGLSSEAAVQSWFVKRIGNFVSAKNRKAILWDDMLEVGLPAQATLMCWQRFGGATRSAINAARAKYEVIMTPDDFTYFNHPQADPGLEPVGLGSPTSLTKVYYFEPVPVELKAEEAAYVIGAEGCLWTEFMKTPKEVEYMMFPRAIALAEVLWTKRENRNFNAFSRRLLKELPNLNRDQVVYKNPQTYGFGDRSVTVQNKPQKPLAPAHVDSANRRSAPAEKESAKISGAAAKKIDGKQ